jgi:hypothetical protein
VGRGLLLGGAALLAGLALLLLRSPPGRGLAAGNAGSSPDERARTADDPLRLDATPRAAGGEPAPEQGDAREPLAPLVLGAVAHAVLGTLVDADGAPIAGASVTLFDGPLHGPAVRRAAQPLHTVATDAAGRYRFAVVQERLLGVRASAPGFATESRNQSPDVDVPFELGRLTRLTGRLLGTDAARARVLALPEPDAHWQRVDDGTGRYALGDVGVGSSLRLRVEPAGCVAFEVGLTVTTPGEHVHDVELGERVRLAGVVIDALARRPVASAELRADERTLAVTDALGRFELELQGPPARALAPDGDRASDVHLRLGAPMYLESSVALRAIARGEPVQLVPAGRVEGRVLAAAGAPDEGALVRWVAPRTILDPRLGPLKVPDGPLETRTGSDGRFALDGVPCGTRAGELVVLHGTGEHWVLDAAPAEAHARVLEIRLASGRALQGRVAWGDYLLGDMRAPGVPAPRVTVRASLRDDTEVARATTDARGLFELTDLPQDELWLTVPGELWRDATVHVPGGSTAAVRLEIVPPYRSVRGVLRDARGAPLARQDIAVRCTADDAAGRGGFGARTDEQGAFTVQVPDLEALAPRLVVPRGFVSLEHGLVAPELDWTLPELVPVALVLAEATELPRLVAWTGPGALEGGRTERHERPLDGVLQLELPAGALELELTCVEPEPRRLIRKSVHVPRGSDTPVRIVLGP